MFSGWVASLFAADTSSSSVDLTPAERSWIAAHPKLRVGYDADWPPFSFERSTGGLSGIDGDILQLLSDRLGLKFEPVHGSNWTETFARAKQGDIDILAGTARTPEREQNFHFTIPYQSFPAGIITRGDQPFLWSVYDLDGKTVAGPRDYVTMTELARETLKRMCAGMEDDLNTAQAQAAIFDMVRKANAAIDAGQLKKDDAATLLDVLQKFDQIFAVLKDDETEKMKKILDWARSENREKDVSDTLVKTVDAQQLSDAGIEQKIAEMEQARRSRNFHSSDAIRAELTAAGIVVENTKDGVRWKRK